MMGLGEARKGNLLDEDGNLGDELQFGGQLLQLAHLGRRQEALVHGSACAATSALPPHASRPPLMDNPMSSPASGTSRTAPPPRAAVRRIPACSPSCLPRTPNLHSPVPLEAPPTAHARPHATLRAPVQAYSRTCTRIRPHMFITLSRRTHAHAPAQGAFLICKGTAVWGTPARVASAFDLHACCRSLAHARSLSVNADFSQEGGGASAPKARQKRF